MISIVNNRYVRVLIICIISYCCLAACVTAPLEIKYKSFNDQSYSKRPNLAIVHKDSIETLLKSQYLLIGYIDVRRNIRKCYEDDSCVTVTDDMPTEKDVLREAADRGGDIVFILEDRDISTNISKSICTATSVSATTVNGIVQMTTICTSYAKVYGVLESKVSRALIWRLDPENANIEANSQAIKTAMLTMAAQKKASNEEDEGFSLFNKDKKEKYSAPFKLAYERAYAGDKKYQAILGYAFETGKGVKKNYTRALFWYKKSAKQGFALAQSRLGSMYYLGKGTRTDYRMAFFWTKAAAEQDSVRAAYNLCVLYGKGLGVTQNYKQAFNWCSKAKEKGHVSASVNLANMYLKGRGVDVNKKVALELYQNGAEKGNRIAQYNLAVNYFKGKIIEKNIKTGLKWLKKSAGQKFHPAQYMLGLFYEGGYGIKANPKKSLIWYKRAVRNGSKRAYNRLKKKNSVGNE